MHDKDVQIVVPPHAIMDVIANRREIVEYLKSLGYRTVMLSLDTI